MKGHIRGSLTPPVGTGFVVDLEVDLSEAETMRLHCTFCSKSVSSAVDKETVVRALLVCPECLEEGKVELPDQLAKRDD